ncbi:MAG TPA: SpoIIE family protein phosphatase [Terracidiphilus sp.]|nr:SpoIIE family protein phosphatase [Terracidiphilus sp.]
MIVAAVWLALLAIPGMCASSDTFRAPSPGPGSMLIEGKWQFHLGDEQDWAAPSLDDGSWEQLDARTTWGDQTHPGYTGFAWYRKHIQIGGRGGRIAVLIPPVEDAYEIYWNGHKIGECGKLPPHAWWWQRRRGAVYGLDAAPLDGVLALRVWKAPLESNEEPWIGGLWATPILGSPAVLTPRVQFAQTKQEDMMLPRFMFAGALFITGIVALVLFIRERRNLVYLWLGLVFIANFLECLEGLKPLSFSMTHFVGTLYYGLALALQHFSLWMLLLTLFGWHSRRTWKLWTVAVIALHLSALAVDLALQAFWEMAGPVMQAADMVCAAIVALTPVYLLVIVIAGARRLLSRGLLPMAVTVTLYDSYNLVVESSWVGIRYTHFELPWFHLNPAFPLGPYVYGVPAILNTMLFLVLLYTVVRERSREVRRQVHIENEIASAHEVQDILIPADPPAIPGFTISSVYKPAAEVGGDFYQVIPLRDEEGEPGALILLGDVSGKGLKAAMTVSLIVGTVRALAEFTDDPAEILTRLNRRLLGRTRGGFATCTALRMESGGRTTIANAGHLAPFRTGSEIELPGSLPLGLTADERYESRTLYLEPGETLTLMTDGVLEARGPRGELYGYERLSALMEAQPTVQEIVNAACSFGQDDDITVLTVTRIADTERSDARLHLVAQIAAAG